MTTHLDFDAAPRHRLELVDHLRVASVCTYRSCGWCIHRSCALVSDRTLDPINERWVLQLGLWATLTHPHKPLSSLHHQTTVSFTHVPCICLAYSRPLLRGSASAASRSASFLKKYARYVMSGMGVACSVGVGLGRC